MQRKWPLENPEGRSSQSRENKLAMPRHVLRGHQSGRTDRLEQSAEVRRQRRDPE